jgi:hypothetical protein
VQQIQQILGFIQEPSKRRDAILVEPAGTGMPQVAKAAVSAEIAWGVVNTEVDYIPALRQRALVPVLSIVSDHEEIGKLQASRSRQSSGMKDACSIVKARASATSPD